MKQYDTLIFKIIFVFPMWAGILTMYYALLIYHDNDISFKTFVLYGALGFLVFIGSFYLICRIEEIEIKRGAKNGSGKNIRK